MDASAPHLTPSGFQGGDFGRSLHWPWQGWLRLLLDQQNTASSAGPANLSTRLCEDDAEHRSHARGPIEAIAFDKTDEDRLSRLLLCDNRATARTIGGQAGIDDDRGNLLPEDKLAAIEDLQRRYGTTAMTGDGINDAPALARADMGIAMGAAGTATAMEAADIVIMNDDLRRIPEAIALSRRTHAVLWQNIVLALGIKAVFLLLAVFGSATMWMAVAADMGASLLVVFNGLRLVGPRGAG